MSRTSKAAKVWAIVIMATMLVTYSATAVAVAVSLMTEEDTSVEAIEAELPKAKMPEIDLETLEATSVQYALPKEHTNPAVKYNVLIEQYTVQPGDCLSSIAQMAYGDERLYPYIMKHNDMDSNTVIHPGDVLDIVYPDNNDKVLKECLEYINSNSKKTTPSSIKQSGNAKNGTAPAKDGMTYVGQYKITGYDPWCAHCCGKANGITASGKEAKVGRTIAAKGFKFGTKLYIEGYGTYVVEDTGGFKSNVIDVAAASHEACYKLTRSNVAVYVVN